MHENIGYSFLDGSREHGSDHESSQAISEWAKAKDIDVVVWTDLPPRFEEVRRKPFSVDAAVAYLRGLPREGQLKAAEYVGRAPDFVQTPLRRALEGQPWFPKPRA